MNFVVRNANPSNGFPRKRTLCPRRNLFIFSSAEAFAYFPKLGKKTEFEHRIEMDSTKSDKNGSGKKSRENTAFDKTSGNEENVANSECDVPELKAEAALSPEVSERVELDKKENCLREILKDGGVVKKMGGTLLLPEGNKDVQHHDEEIGNVQSDNLRGRVPESMAKAPLSLKESKDVQPDQKRVRQREILTDSDKVKKMGGNRLGLLALVGAIVCLVAIAVIYISPPERVTKGDFDLAKDFENGVDQLQLSFINQTKRFWKILKNRKRT